MPSRFHLTAAVLIDMQVVRRVDFGIFQSVLRLSNAFTALN